MTRPDDAESVKLLREAIERLLHTSNLAAWDNAKAALAATAPPKFYIDGSKVREHGEAGSVLEFLGAHGAERAAVLDALNALAEKEASR